MNLLLEPLRKHRYQKKGDIEEPIKQQQKNKPCLKRQKSLFFCFRNTLKAYKMVAAIYLFSFAAGLLVAIHDDLPQFLKTLGNNTYFRAMVFYLLLKGLLSIKGRKDLQVDPLIHHVEKKEEASEWDLPGLYNTKKDKNKNLPQFFKDKKINTSYTRIPSNRRPQTRPFAQTRLPKTPVVIRSKNRLCHYTPMKKAVLMAEILNVK